MPVGTLSLSDFTGVNIIFNILPQYNLNFKVWFVLIVIWQQISGQKYFVWTRMEPSKNLKSLDICIICIKDAKLLKKLKTCFKMNCDDLHCCIFGDNLHCCIFGDNISSLVPRYVIVSGSAVNKVRWKPILLQKNII